MDDILKEDDYFYQSVEDMNTTDYAEHLGLGYEYSDVCNYKEELDAVVLCLWTIDQERNNYDHATSLAPKDTTGRLKKINELLHGTTRLQRKDILIEWKATYPWKSEVMDMKHDILEGCNNILKSTGMGKKRRDKILPRLTEYFFQ